MEISNFIQWVKTFFLILDTKGVENYVTRAREGGLTSSRLVIACGPGHVVRDCFSGCFVPREGDPDERG